MQDRALELRRLTWALLRDVRRYRSAADAALRALGLSDATALPVLLLARLGDGVRQGELAAEMGVEGPSLVRLLDQLGGAGLIARVEDPQDRRVRRVRLTPRGRALALEAEAVLDALRARLFAHASDADLAGCLATLDGLGQELGKTPGRLRDAAS